MGRFCRYFRVSDFSDFSRENAMCEQRHKSFSTLDKTWDHLFLEKYTMWKFPILYMNFLERRTSWKYWLSVLFPIWQKKNLCIFTSSRPLRIFHYKILKIFKKNSIIWKWKKILILSFLVYRNFSYIFLLLPIFKITFFYRIEGRMKQNIKNNFLTLEKNLKKVVL